MRRCSRTATGWPRWSAMPSRLRPGWSIPRRARISYPAARDSSKRSALEARAFRAVRTTWPILKSRGIPTANISTTEFVAAAKVQCTNLGVPSYEVVTVPHPIVPLTKEEVWGSCRRGHGYHRGPADQRRRPRRRPVSGCSSTQRAATPAVVRHPRLRSTRSSRGRSRSPRRLSRPEP